MIPDQIVSSVQNSRRTIIILSKVTENTVVVTSFKGTVHRDIGPLVCFINQLYRGSLITGQIIFSYSVCILIRRDIRYGIYGKLHSALAF